MHLCTNCRRCESVCPAGIHSTELWFNVREALLEGRNAPEFLLLSPLAFYRGLRRQSLGEAQYGTPLHLARDAVTAECKGLSDRSLPLHPGNGLEGVNGSLKATDYSSCYRCRTCSISCPVVRNYTDAEEALGLLPHQIMHAVGLKLWDLVFSSKMLWNCLGCYQCQENCPQCVKVADVIYGLKNAAISQALTGMRGKS